VTVDWGMLRCFAGFTLGMLLYQLYHQQTAFRLLNSGWVFIVSFALTLASMHFNWHQMLIIALFPVVILSAAYNQDFVKRFLETRPLQRLGDWSFSIYLVHMPIVYAVYCFMLFHNPDKLSSLEAFGYGQLSYAQAWLQCLGLVAATLIVSAFTYYYFEVPSRKYLNTWFKARAKKAVSETVIS
jgi:peptidoglycan/LPS O-acetylase OafA/YrhL